MWLRHLFHIVVLISAIGSAVFSAHWVMSTPENSPPLKSVSSLTTILSEKNIAQLQVMLVQEDGDQRRIFRCQNNSCQRLNEPDTIESKPVTDGGSWYYYVEKNDELSRGMKKVLQRTWIDDGRTETIVEQTPLVRPRDLAISPNGQRVAYWLDNTDDKKKNLTEAWIYDAAQGSTRLAAEKVDKDYVQSRLRWNRSSSHVWFLTQAQPQAAPQLQLVQAQPIRVSTPFSNVNWSEFMPEADHGVVDISLSGRSLAYVVPGDQPRLVIATQQSGSQPARTVNGGVPFLQWLDDGSLFYAVQEKDSVAFWRVTGSVHQQVAFQSGIIRSAQTDQKNQNLIAVIEKGRNQQQLIVMSLNNYQIASLGEVSRYGQATHVVHVTTSENALVTPEKVTEELSDEQLVAFTQQHLVKIAEQPDATPITLIITNELNTLYADYRLANGKEERVLFTVQDAIHPEWNVHNRYVRDGAEWRPLTPTDRREPAPLRLYQWEQELGRWVLKSQIAPAHSRQPLPS